MRFLTKALMILAAIALVVSFGVQQAKADALLFPYFKSGGGAYTFVSLQTSWNGPVFVAYYYDLLATAATECIHEDHAGWMTAFDLWQYEITNQINLGLTFGDAGWVGGGPVAAMNQAMRNFHLLVPNTQGFFIVDDPIAVEGDFYGQAVVVDSASGIIAGYKGLNNPTSVNPNNFVDPATSKWSFFMSNYPDSVVTTSWFVLATGNINMFTAVPAWTGRVVLSNGFDAVWDRDERLVSGDLAFVVNCFAFINRANIMQVGQVTQSANGGLWWELAIAPAFLDPPTNLVINPATGAFMVKLETTTALGGVRTAMSFENAFPNFPY